MIKYLPYYIKFKLIIMNKIIIFYIFILLNIFKLRESY